jgi:ATP-dependent protease Clp ATPase subunit
MADIACSFCKKNQTKVRVLMAGPSAFIYDECVVLCAQIVMNSHPETVENFEQLAKSAKGLVFE